MQTAKIVQIPIVVELKCLVASEFLASILSVQNTVLPIVIILLGSEHFLLS